MCEQLHDPPGQPRQFWGDFAVWLTDDELQTLLIALMLYQQHKSGTPNVPFLIDNLPIIDKLARALLRRQEEGKIREGTQHAPLRLEQVDTVDTRELLAGLLPLVEIAERVDKARGRVYLDTVAGEVQGNDLAEALAGIVRRLDLEVNGPKGRE